MPTERTTGNEKEDISYKYEKKIDWGFLFLRQTLNPARLRPGHPVLLLTLL